ncbi:MAG: transcription elongation factor GreA [Eubacteriales bacterium]|nr:transcription elongation factor GreA [Eubacteriales bacterium]MDD4582745.1 transcription elongation factor GreA [Eubacteriales bacterium]
MAMSGIILLTQEGYDKIVAEYDDSVTVKRKEVAERIKEAISYGDISENAEYDSAKGEQAELEERIMKLEHMLRNAKILDHNEISDDSVNVGLKVKIKELDSNETIEFTIVGSTEADPFEGKISNESEVGKQLLGKKIGDIAEVNVPDGVIRYEILDIYK